MKKTLSISLANLNFVLEEDAYLKLSAYLEQIRTFFATNPDKEEIVKDIEYSIADKFTQVLSPAKQVITLEDTEKVMSEIGTTRDFKQTENSTEESTSTNNDNTEKKRLFRDEEHKVIGGVCAGIASYFDVDVIWIRALFSVLLFTPLTVIVTIIYIILWFSLPPAHNVVDKLKMQGESVTLEKIAAEFRERIHKQDTPEKNVLKKIASIPIIIITVILRILKTIIPLIFIGVSSIGIVILSAILLVISYTVGIILFFSNSPLVYFPLKDFPTTPIEYTLVILAYFAIILPLVFILTLFISVIKKRFILGTAGTISMVGSWVFILLVSGLLIVGLAPSLQQKIKSKQVVTKIIDIKTLPVENFDTIYLNAPLDSHFIHTTISQSSTYNIVVKGDPNHIDNLKFSKPIMGSNELSLMYDPAPQLCLGCNHGIIEVEITLPNLKGLSILRRNLVTLKDFKADELNLNVYGSAQLHGENIKAKSLRAGLTNHSQLNLKNIDIETTTTLSMMDLSSAFLSGSTTEFNFLGEPRGALNIDGFKIQKYTKLKNIIFID